MKYWLLMCLIFGWMEVALGYDFQKCYNFQTKLGMLRKYDFKYGGPWWITCRTSGKESSFEVYTQHSMHSSTASSDPGVTTGSVLGTTQFSSSWGECNIQGKSERDRQRELFIAENLDEIKRDIAFGRGEHVTTFAYLSSCDSSVQDHFNDVLQNNYEQLRLIDNQSSSFSKSIDGIVRQDFLLNYGCRSI